MSGRSPSSRDKTRQRTFWWGVIVGVVLLTFCLGLPQFHYTAALMIAVILRYKDEPAGALPNWHLAPARTGRRA